MTHPSLDALTSPLRLGTFFAAGTLAWFARDRLPIDWRLAAGSLVVLAAAAIAGAMWTPWPGGLLYIAAPLPLTYLVLYLAARLPGRRINASWDISYGTYIYGMPVIAVLRWAGVSGAVLVPVALLATWLVGAASWRYIERPALSLKDALRQPGLPSHTNHRSRSVRRTRSPLLGPRGNAEPSITSAPTGR